MTTPPRPARRFAAATVAAGCLAGLLVLALSAPHYAPDSLALVASLALLTFVGELRPIVIARGDSRDEVTVSTTFALALVFVGPLWLAVAVQGLAVAVEDSRADKGLLKLSFNVAQYTLTLVAARAVYALVGGHPLLHGAPLGLPDDLPAALLGGAAFFVVNLLLSGTVGALAAEEPVLEHLLGDVRFQLATSGVLVTFAPVVAAAAHLTLWLLPLLVLPIYAIHRSAQLAADREREALHDGLTGLPNRALFRLRVERACEDAARLDRSCAVLLLDLDHFKEINDTLGHHVGDDLLRLVAARLERALPPGDTVARLGGDEFVVLAVGLSGPREAVLLGERLLKVLHDAFRVEDVRLEVGASVGVSLYPQHGDHVDQLLQRSDIALYEAKVERGGLKLYDPAADVHTTERLVLASELREGLERAELFLQHQPQVSLRTGEVVGFEALVRWQHPRRGVVMPDDFLPVVENTGLIGPLTLTVLDLALAAVATWRARGHQVTVAVNLSVRHLTDLDLPLQVQRALLQHGVPPSALVLEVTETLIMSDPVRAAEVLRLLRELGVSLAVDDFGTGYSSLAYLRRLHVHELKIDRSFVRQVMQDEGDAVIVRSTIEMGSNLGLRLVAEGVEDEPTLDLLRSWGCEVAQGFHISRPLDAADVLGFLERPRAALRAAAAPVRAGARSC